MSIVYYSIIESHIIIKGGGAELLYESFLQKEIIVYTFRSHGFHPSLGGCLIWEAQCLHKPGQDTNAFNQSHGGIQAI